MHSLSVFPVDFPKTLRIALRTQDFSFTIRYIHMDLEDVTKGYQRLPKVTKRLPFSKSFKPIRGKGLRQRLPKLPKLPLIRLFFKKK